MAWLHAVIDVPAATASRAADFWCAVLGWPLGGPWPDHPELRSFAPPDGDGYVHLQVVDRSARVHVDLEADDRDDLVRRATALGADLVGEQDRWTTLSSPGGMPFCVVDAVAHQPPGPVAWPHGHRSRLVPLCIDFPRSAQPRQTDFSGPVAAGTPCATPPAWRSASPATHPAWRGGATSADPPSGCGRARQAGLGRSERSAEGRS